MLPSLGVCEGEFAGMYTATRLLISLSFSLLPIYGLTVKPASAEQQLGPSDALVHLTRAHAVAARCKHLTAGERDELSHYSHIAELIVAKEVGAPETIALLEKGQASAAAMNCGSESGKLAVSALDAARHAMQSAENTVRRSGNEPVEIVGSLYPEDEPRQAYDEQSSASDREMEPETFAGRGRLPELDIYERAAAAYYVERRCQHLGYSQSVRFWKAVVARHNALLRRHRKSLVARAKKRAIAIARASGRCGLRTRRMVSSGVSLARR
jgi:hypothetical protein